MSKKREPVNNFESQGLIAKDENDLVKAIK
jgi:hypothetical protein